MNLLETQKMNLEELKLRQRIQFDMLQQTNALIVAAQNHIRLLELPEDEPDLDVFESPDDTRERKEAQAGDREHDRRAAEERG